MTTTTEPPYGQPPMNRTAPWSYLGSVSSDSYNGTGYFIDDDDDLMLNDLKTVFLACLATLVPLVLLVFMACGVRYLWIQYKIRKKTIRPDGINRENTSDSVAKPLHSHLLNDKSSNDAHMTFISDAVEICDEMSTSSSNRPNNLNGSIITMTLKNNHLIVETEERNDIEEDSRETTMRYSPGARDGVFVVEVQQGVRRSPGSGGTSFAEPDRSGSLSDQCALVHNPPEKYSDEETLEECDDSEYFIETTSPERSTPGISTNAKTGLSTSNTSLGSLHRSYCYTNQECYDQGSYGYNIYHGYVNDRVVKRLFDTKPKITSAVYKTNPSVKNLKSMSFDMSVMHKDASKDKFSLVQINSFDNVLESNGLEEFSTNLYKSKPLMENEAFLKGDDCNLPVNIDVKKASNFKKGIINDLNSTDVENVKESQK
ncbi:uncharacterized protein LOC143206969 isoform X2 [Rhynchophorus ferrugineus]|uniref:uncharacterized protein LOC143206969 isoform X2 n=1 Tax=Rhynchophorus ferrugineus TaxID=354439 RepID=UPI003FCEB6D9